VKRRGNPFPPVDFLFTGLLFTFVLTVVSDTLFIALVPGQAWPLGPELTPGLLAMMCSRIWHENLSCIGILF
jgi:hypothetical protein